jgi:transglutaminase-like putative cysteine protease
MPVLEVSGDLSATYLRSEVYGAYVGNGFAAKRMGGDDTRAMDPASESPRTIDEGKVYFFETGSVPTGVGRHRIKVESLARRHSSAYIPPGPVQRFEYDGDVTAFYNDLVYLPDLFRPGNIYSVETAPPRVSPEILRAAPPANRRRNLSRNTGPYSDQTARSVRELAQQAAARGRTDYDDVQEIIREIQQRTEYNLQAEGISGQVDRVETFLFDTQEGYCDLFASSLTVMCRAIGLQARAVSGYLAPPEEARGGSIIVRDRHAHLWTEVFFEGIGWVTFDATSGARAVAGGEVGSLLDEGGLDDAGAAFAATIGGVIFGLSFMGLLVGGFWTRIKAIFAKKGIERRVAPYYQDFLKALGFVLKRPKQLAETTREYANAYVAVRPDGAEALILASMLDRALFSAASLSDDEWANLKRRTAELAAASKKHARAS